MADGGDARALVHVEADVPFIGQPRLARVQPHPNAYRPVRQRALAVGSSGDSVRRAGEGDEERVTLRIDLDALMLGKRRPETPPMLVQRLSVVVAKLVQQPRRALHVREQQRHNAGREIAHHPHDHGATPVRCPGSSMQASSYGIAKRSERALAIVGCPPAATPD